MPTVPTSRRSLVSEKHPSEARSPLLRATATKPERKKKRQPPQHHTGSMFPLTPDELVFHRIVAIDTEDDSQGRVTECAACWFDETGKVQSFVCRTPQEMVTWMEVQPKSLFVAHNLEYDLVNLYRELQWRGLRDLTYTARLIKARLENSESWCLDSYNFFPFSLAKMGKVIGLEKLKMDIHSVEYVTRDAEILLRWMTDFQTRCHEAVGINITATIGGLAMKAWRTNFQDRTYTSFNDAVALEAYYGGRCEIFHKGKVEGPVRAPDVNSMYPFVMTFEYPDSGTMQKASYRTTKFGVGRFVVYVPEDTFVPVLPTRIEDRLHFPTGWIEGTWTYHEIRRAVEKGAKVAKEWDSWGTDVACRPFDKYVQTYYALRLDSKDDAESTFWKLLLNNLYGRLGQHNDRIEIVTQPMSRRALAKTGAELIRKTGRFYVYRLPLLEPPETANYLWAAYVTSYARLHLEGLLQSVHDQGKTLCYCDTDSVMYQGVEAAKLDIDLTRLGALKEEVYDSGEFLISKGYVLRKGDEIKIACKGVNVPRELDKALHGTNENPQFKFLYEGEATVKKPIRLRQSLVTGQKANVWKDHTKANKAVYERRIGEGVTKPVHLVLKKKESKNV